MQPNILLIEEYNPLGVAISSALRIFAPGHKTHRVRSLAEAEKLHQKLAPEILIIDFDPPFPNLTEFLQKISQSHPESGVVVMANGVSTEMSAVSGGGSLQFLQKPFNVEDFGAAVRRILAPTEDPDRGRLETLGAIDLVMVQCVGARTVVLEAKGKNGRAGRIHIRDGQLIHAESGRHDGVDALERILAWPDAKIRETNKPVPRRRTIKGRWSTVLLEANRDLEMFQGHDRRRRREPIQEEPPTEVSNKIVVIDDTEMILIFVQDILESADPKLQITTALTGFSGVSEVERVQPDLVVLDYSLPDINGDEVCRRLLQNPATSTIPVLMMSGHVAEMAKTAAEQPNVVATIEKPFLSEPFVALVEKTLKGERAPKPSAAKPPPVEREEAPAPVVERTAPVEPPATVAPARESTAAELTVGSSLAESEAMAFRREPLIPQRPLSSGEPARTATIPAPVVSSEVDDVVLGVFLEVISMELNESFRMGSIRARVSSQTVSLHVANPALRAALPANGFQLGPVERDRSGRISALRAVPTQQPFHPLPTRNVVDIARLAVVPANSHEHVQLTPTQNGQMTMQLLAHLQLGGVELSTNFQIRNLVLRTRSNKVRVTLNPQAIDYDATGTSCNIVEVKVDPAGRIIELLLNPTR